MNRKLEIATNNDLRIAIIDPLPIFRVGVSKVLGDSRISDTILEGNCGADALRFVGDRSVDLILVNPNVPDGGGKLIATIASLKTDTRLLVLSNSEELANVTGALRFGASGYILRNSESTELVNAVRMVASGNVYLTPSLGARLVAHQAAIGAARGPASLLASLTRREKDIVGILGCGATNKEIARKLTISEATVKYFMTSILQKLQVRNRLEVVVATRGMDGIDPPPAQEPGALDRNAKSRTTGDRSFAASA